MKNFIRALSVSIVVLFLMNISVALLQETDHVGKLNNNSNHRYLVSALLDYDLNLKNQILESEKWLFSKTGNYPDLHSWGGIIIWIPFYIYVIILGFLKLINFNCIVDQVDFAQALAAILCFSVLFINITKIQKILKPETEGAKLLIMATFLATPTWWYVLVEPSGSVITYLAILSMILLYFIDSKTERIKSNSWLVLGALSGILIVIYNGGYFTFFAIFLYVIYLKIKKTIITKNLFFFTGGATVVLMLEAFNSNIKFGKWITITDFVNETYQRVPRKLMLFESLFGSGGVIYMFPIYLLSIVGLYNLFYELFTYKKSKNYDVYLIPVFVIAGLLNYLVNIYYWTPEKNFLGAGLLESQLLLTLGFVAHFNKKRSLIYKIIILVCSSAWSLVMLANYYVDRNAPMVAINPVRIKFIYGTIINDFSQISYHYKNTFIYSLFWLPVILLGAMLFYNFIINPKKWNTFIKAMSIFIIFFFVLISLSNVYQHSRPNRFFLPSQKEAVVSEDLKLFSYASYIDFLYKEYLSAVNLRKDELASNLNYKITEYNESVLTDLKVIPSFFNPEAARQGRSLFGESRENEVINLKRNLCNKNIESRLD